MADNNSNERKVNATTDRLVKGYPSVKYKQLLVNYAETNEISQSKALTIAIKQFFDTMKPDERERIKLGKHSY